MADGDAAGREDRRAVGELGFVAGGRGSFVPLQRQILRPGRRSGKTPRAGGDPLRCQDMHPMAFCF